MCIRDREDVERMSILARLELSEDEQSLFAEQLSEISRIIDSLAEVDTEDMDEMIFPSELGNVFREDTVLPVSYTHLDVYKRQGTMYWMIL